MTYWDNVDIPGFRFLKQRTRVLQSLEDSLIDGNINFIFIFTIKVIYATALGEMDRYTVT